QLCPERVGVVVVDGSRGPLPAAGNRRDLEGLVAAPDRQAPDTLADEAGPLLTVGQDPAAGMAANHRSRHSPAGRVELIEGRLDAAHAVHEGQAAVPATHDLG